MWSDSQSDQVFSTFEDHPRLTTVIPAETLGGSQFLDTEATAVAAAIRARAEEAHIPIVVRTRACEHQPGYAHVVVYHTPDVTGTRIVH